MSFALLTDAFFSIKPDIRIFSLSTQSHRPLLVAGEIRSVVLPMLILHIKDLYLSMMRTLDKLRMLSRATASTGKVTTKSSASDSMGSFNDASDKNTLS